MPPVHLNEAQRSTLVALTRTVLPHLFDEAGSDLHNIQKQVEDRLRDAPALVTRDLAAALTLLGSRLAGGLVAGRPVSFSRLGHDDQALVFARWGRSAIPVARSVHQALRRVILSTWYGTDDGRRDAGVLPPLHTRSPAFAWEGPVFASEPAANHGVVAPTVSASRDVPRANPRPRPIPQGVITPGAFSGSISLTADVVIIGSGAGGAVAAARFAQAHRQVVMLEEGDYVHAPDFNELERDMVPRLFADQAMRTTTDGSVSLLQGSAVGGGTTANWMMMLRPPEHVLDEWFHKLHIPGFTSRDLVRHVERVGDEVHAREVPFDAHAPSNLAIIEGATALKWRARAAAINAKGCVRAGSCSLGCRYDAKMGALLTFLPRAFGAGARLYAGASVTRVEVLERETNSRTPPRKRVHAIVRDPRTGTVRGHLTVDAPVVVLAAGAVGTPIILQRSGLGGGGVGRYLRLHPTTAVFGRYARETYPMAGIPQTALSDEFIRRDANGYGFWIECPSLQPALASAALPGFGAVHREWMRQLNHCIPFIVLVRDGSGVDASMGSVTLDRAGRVRIRHKLSPADRENLQLGIAAAARLHLAAGCEEALSLHTPPIRATSEGDLRAMQRASIAPNRVALFSAHVNGTCRLGVDPASSGCSPSGERHGTRGLFVMDGSLLPTAPGVNPQWTIMAMASLLAERQL